MVRERKIELMNDELLTWPVQVWSIIALIATLFFLVVAGVCLYCELFVDYYKIK